MRGAQERCDSRRSLIHVFGAAPLCCQSRLVYVLNVMFAVTDSGWWSYLFCRGWRSACKRNSLLDAIPLNVDPNSPIWCVEGQSLLSTTQCPRVNRTRNRPAIHPSRGRKRCHAAWRKKRKPQGMAMARHKTLCTKEIVSHLGNSSGWDGRSGADQQQLRIRLKSITASSFRAEKARCAPGELHSTLNTTVVSQTNCSEAATTTQPERERETDDEICNMELGVQKPPARATTEHTPSTCHASRGQKTLRPGSSTAGDRKKHHQFDLHSSHFFSQPYLV